MVVDCGLDFPSTTPYINERTRRQNAEERAKELLVSLNPTLVKQIEKGGAFYLNGPTFVYIVNVDLRAVTVLFEDRPRSLCIYIRNRDVQDNKYDWAIAMWMHIKANEVEFLRIANHFEWRPQTVTETLERVTVPRYQGQHADMVIHDDVTDTPF